jgi:hypothetical protein
MCHGPLTKAVQFLFIQKRKVQKYEEMDLFRNGNYDDPVTGSLWRN